MDKSLFYQDKYTKSACAKLLLDWWTGNLMPDLEKTGSEIIKIAHLRLNCVKTCCYKNISIFCNISPTNFTIVHYVGKSFKVWQWVFFPSLKYTFRQKFVLANDKLRWAPKQPWSIAMPNLMFALRPDLANKHSTAILVVGTTTTWKI